MLKKTLIIIILVCIFATTLSSAEGEQDHTLFKVYENIELDKEWTIRFNNIIDANTVNNDSVYIEDAYGRNMASSIEIIDSRNIRITPHNEYNPDSSYYLFVNNQVRDSKGGTLKESVYISFTTVGNNNSDQPTNPDDNINPTITSTYRSSYFSDDYLKVEISSDNTLHYQGSVLSNYRNVVFRIEDKNTGEIQIDRHNRIIDRTFEDYTLFPNVDGEYSMNVYYGETEMGRYDGIYIGIPMEVESGKLKFLPSIVYDNNIQQTSSNNRVLETDTIISGISNSDIFRLTNLAEEITEGIIDDYDKLYALTNWVSNNIYYDKDAYYLGMETFYDTMGTLNSKKSVCQGYAQLTMDLVKSIGLPARMITGHALGVSANGASWEDVNHNETNHAWNEIFIDGRWIIVDSTWNSRNVYSGGEFIKGDSINKYFDPTLESFSYSHKILTR